MQRYSFLDVVAADVARISADEFGWPDSDLRRVVSIITSGDEDAVRASLIVASKGEIPGTILVVFFAPEEQAAGSQLGDDLARRRKRGEILQETSLLEVVEATANALYEKMVRAGFEFSGVAGATKPRRSGN